MLFGKFKQVFGFVFTLLRCELQNVKETTDAFEMFIEQTISNRRFTFLLTFRKLLTSILLEQEEDPFTLQTAKNLSNYLLKNHKLNKIDCWLSDVG